MDYEALDAVKVAVLLPKDLFGEVVNLIFFSATLERVSTFTREPKVLVLSMSMEVLVRRILAFLIFVGWPNPAILRGKVPTP